MKGKTTTGQPQTSKNTDTCIVNQKIRNRFKEIIDETLKEQHKVLNTRKNDLKKWEDDEKK